VEFVNSKVEQDENLKVLHSIPDFMCFSPEVPRIILMTSKGVVENDIENITNKIIAFIPTTIDEKKDLYNPHIKYKHILQNCNEKISYIWK
jgi:hypothetical protein